MLWELPYTTGVALKEKEKKKEMKCTTQYMNKECKQLINK